jgi:hypothetical protein
LDFAVLGDGRAMPIRTRIRLQSDPSRGIHGLAVITAQGEIEMTEIPETTANPEGNTPAVEPAHTKKARVAARARHVAPSKSKPPKTAAATKKTRTAANAAKPKKGARARQGSKTAKFVELLKRPGGATGADLMKATGWQAHSVRGFISGVLGRKMGLKVTSKVDNGERRYSLKG